MANKQRCIVLPVDGSENAERAYDFYRANIQRPGDYIVVVHVVEPPNFSSMGMIGLNLPTEEWTKIIQENNQKASKLEATWCDKMRADGTAFKYQHVMCNKPGSGIVDLATEAGGDLIIMGNRGLGKIRRTVMGSVSDYVLHHAHVPVGIVPPPHK